jgi:hypothetical protein
VPLGDITMEDKNKKSELAGLLVLALVVLF